MEKNKKADVKSEKEKAYRSFSGTPYSEMQLSANVDKAAL